MDDLDRGFVAGVVAACWLAAAVFASSWVCGYRVTQHPPEPVLVPIDCKVVA